MLKYLYNIFNKKRVKNIYNAPTKYLMKKYGGTLDFQEYKHLLKKIKHN